MKKLRFQIEKLRVEQFEVQSDSPVARGTVQAFEETSAFETCYWRLCLDVPETHSCYC